MIKFNNDQTNIIFTFATLSSKLIIKKTNILTKLNQIYFIFLHAYIYIQFTLNYSNTNNISYNYHILAQDIFSLLSCMQRNSNHVSRLRTE